VVDWLLVDVWALERYLLVEKLGELPQRPARKIARALRATKGFTDEHVVVSDGRQDKVCA
jgi:hypothetical protein